MRIDVVIVDDDELDRYVAKRRLAKFDEFGQIEEASSGDDFLENHYADTTDTQIPPAPLLVLMDVNMPRLNGFETVHKLEQRIAEGRARRSVVVMMYTSSNNPQDQEQADTIDLIKGYVLKPLNSQGVNRILELYHS